MKKTFCKNGKRLSAMFLVVALVLSMFSMTAFAAMDGEYRDPAVNWKRAMNRTNELDSNALCAQGTAFCNVCGRNTQFESYRVPEYTTNGETAYIRGAYYSDGTTKDGSSTVPILDGIPGVNAYYTGYHWTKVVCETCGTINANMGVNTYGFDKNVYWIYDCAPEFRVNLDTEVSYDYVDSSYHSKTVTTADYCNFCYGTYKSSTTNLVRHTMNKEVIPQISNGRFAIVESCKDCGFVKTSYVAAKSVIADYYGIVDGQPHTLTVSDLSESGVTTQIRYGLTATGCTMTSAPNYTEQGQYLVYYEITYSYGGQSMTENGVANVWLYAENETCPCGCGHENCDCGGNKNCDGSCNTGNCNGGVSGGSGQHNFVVLETVKPTCAALGYTRYLCVGCGLIEKRDYVDSIGHAWQSVLIRDATCEAEGKTIDICANCGKVTTSVTPKGEHDWFSYDVEATCLSSGYTVKECSVCGERHITDITNANAHNYVSVVTKPTCETGGFTLHICYGCGSSFTTDYKEALGHNFDSGKTITVPTCNGEGVVQYTCTRCGEHYLEATSAKGHSFGDGASCTEPATCIDCGAVLENAMGHDYAVKVTAPTCTKMGFTTYTCTRCGDSYKGDYIEAKGHTESDWIVDKAPTTSENGSKHKECVVCGEKLVTESIIKLYLTATTDTHGEAVVGEYLVIVTDTDTKNPVANATVSLNEDGSITVTLPNGRVIDYADLTTVTVLMNGDKSPVKDILVAVNDKNSNYAEKYTDKNGNITVPDTTGVTNGDGKATVGYEDADGNRFTLTVDVRDRETGRPIKGAKVSVGKTGKITVILPDGTDFDEDNRIVITVTDNNKKPVDEQEVIVKGDLGQNETGKTDEDGKLVVPAVVESEKHNAYIYGYPDGTFGISKNMSRAEAAAIFARLLAEKKGDLLTQSAVTEVIYTDVPNNAWYASSVKYLTNYGVVFGVGGNLFAPEREITRAEFVTMAVRFFNAYGDGAADIMEQYTGFNDVASGYWAAKYIQEATVHGWIYGYGDGTFRAEKAINRGEVVAIMNRLLDRKADKAYIAKNLRFLNNFTDLNPEYWAYYDVLEAANTHVATFNNGESWSK